MDAGELFRAGKLQEAVAAQLADVKAHPADRAKRLFLFELLAFSGDLERAKRQLDALSYEELELQAAAADYRKLLEAEEARRKVFGDGAQPKFLVNTPPEHVRLRVQALAQLRAGAAADAAESLAQAAEACPPVSGKLNDAPFGDLRDCDDLFGPVLEVFAQGNYFWVPLETVDTIAILPPRFPRDLLVGESPAGNGRRRRSGVSPALYPGSHAHADEAVKLGRQTDWIGDDGAPVSGRGLRMFLADDDASTLLEWRDVQFDRAAEDEPGGAEPASR